MNQKELKELIEFLIEKDIAEFELERGDIKMRFKRASAPAVTPYFAVHPAPASASDASTSVLPPPPPAPKELEPAPEEPLHMVRSPIVGTFYESPSPGSPPF